MNQPFKPRPKTSIDLPPVPAAGRPGPVAGLFVTALLAWLAPPAAGGETDRVSISSTGLEGNEASASPAISRTGRFVAFWSAASNLVDDDGNGKWDIFVRDRKKETTTRVSVACSGIEGDGDSSLFVSISANGRFVAFSSLSANLVAGDTNTVRDVFVHDRKKSRTTRVSVGRGGVQANGWSSNPSISASGRFVAFWSEASNLVKNDTNQQRDVFVHDLKRHRTKRVSVSTAGLESNDECGPPSISANGRFVAFSSLASNLVRDDGNAAWDVFVRDRKKRKTRRVSVDSDGLEAADWSLSPSISRTGRFVSFESLASNLVQGDSNDTWDVFVHDRKKRRTKRISIDSAGLQANERSMWSKISANGRFVAFDSLASNLVQGDGNDTWDAFVHDRKKRRTKRVSVDSLGIESVAGGGAASISGNGRFVAFHSESTNLVETDRNNIDDVFVHDRK